jgi:hypothetical protein
MDRRKREKKGGGYRKREGEWGSGGEEGDAAG